MMIRLIRLAWGLAILMLMAGTTEAVPVLWARRAEVEVALLLVVAYGVAPVIGVLLMLVRDRR